MPAILSVHTEPDDVKARLASMGLTEEPLLHAARRWYLSWISFTANHPAFVLHRAGAEVRCELSLPSELSRDGRITRWQERIMLPSIPLDGAEIEIVAPEGPDLDIDVKRKA